MNVNQQIRYGGVIHASRGLGGVAASCPTCGEVFKCSATRNALADASRVRGMVMAHIRAAHSEKGKATL